MKAFLCFFTGMEELIRTRLQRYKDTSLSLSSASIFFNTSFVDEISFNMAQLYLTVYNIIWLNLYITVFNIHLDVC